MEETNRGNNLNGEREAIFAQIFDGLDQLLEATSHLKAASKHRSGYVPIYALWEAKEDAYKEVSNLISMIARKERRYETDWDWKE